MWALLGSGSLCWKGEDQLGFLSSSLFSWSWVSEELLHLPCPLVGMVRHEMLTEKSEDAFAPIFCSSLSNNNLCVWPPSFKPSLTWLCFLPAEIKHVVRDCSIPPKVAGKCRCPVKVLELDAVIYVWWICNRSYTKGNKKSVLSLDMEKMVDCRVAVGISEMLNLKELKSEVMHECLTLVLAALEPTQIGCMKLKWKQRGWINTP